MPVDGSNGASDIGLKLGSCSVNCIPKVDLVGQFWECGQECLDGGKRTGCSKVLIFLIVNHWLQILEKATTHGKGQGDDTREDIEATTTSLPADRATPIVTRTTSCVSILERISRDTPVL